MLPIILFVLVFSLFIEKWIKLGPAPLMDAATVGLIFALAAYIALSSRYSGFDRDLGFVAIGIVLGHLLPHLKRSHRT
jgi:hypothetical protein